MCVDGLLGRDESALQNTHTLLLFQEKPQGSVPTLSNQKQTEVKSLRTRWTFDETREVLKF